MPEYKKQQRLKPSDENMNWMPPRNEWDFRSIDEEEFRFACLWEYVRSIRTFDSSVPANVVSWVKVGQGVGLKTGRYLCSRARDLAKPYTTINDMVYKKLAVDDFINLPAFVMKLKRRAEPVSSFLWDNLSEATKNKLLGCKQNAVPEQPAQASLINDLNSILTRNDFYNEQRFSAVQLEGGTRIKHKELPLEEFKLYERPLKDTHLYNKWVLEESYPQEIYRNRTIKPLDWRTFDAFGRATLIQSMERIRKRMKENIEDGHPPMEVIDNSLGRKHYALSVNFKRGSIRKITEELVAWVKKEAKHFPSPRVGKATQPRNDCLKWLAAYRLEPARKKAGIRFEEMKKRLVEHKNKFAVNDCLVLPIYHTQNAWIKAIGQATELLDLLESDPAAFEQKTLY